MLESLTAKQFERWRQYARQRPFGFEMYSNLFALLTTVVAKSSPFRTGPPVTFQRLKWDPNQETVEPKSAAQSDVQAMAGASGVTVVDLSRPRPK